MSALRKAAIAACLFGALTLAGPAGARTLAFLTPTQMQNVVETRGVSFNGFDHLGGYRVLVDIAKCRGLRRYGVRSVSGKTAFRGFKCSITTDDESRYTVWLLATSRMTFYVKSASLDWSSDARVENCVEWGTDWAECLDQYRP